MLFASCGWVAFVDTASKLFVPARGAPFGMRLKSNDFAKRSRRWRSSRPLRSGGVPFFQRLVTPPSFLAQPQRNVLSHVMLVQVIRELTTIELLGTRAPLPRFYFDPILPPVQPCSHVRMLELRIARAVAVDLRCTAKWVFLSRPLMRMAVHRPLHRHPVYGAVCDRKAANLRFALFRGTTNPLFAESRLIIRTFHAGTSTPMARRTWMTKATCISQTSPHVRNDASLKLSWSSGTKESSCWSRHERSKQTILQERRGP
mmetsp:Transcript_10020/g.24791  ORF Transcript_10020/g.24791 Transcript_10020/m.24791 type:complete len:259 (+) Transcript_10020:96-872(+)